MPVSARIGGISESPTLALNAKAKELKSKGVDVVNFTAGEPDFDTPDNIKHAAIKAIKDGFTKYTPPAGTPELRKAIADKLKRENGLDYGPNQIIVSCGGKHSLYNAVMTVCNPGDEVIIPSPYWVTYPEQVKLAGGEPVIAKTSGEGFRLLAKDIEGKLTRRTKAIILNSPNNPTGAVYEKSELKKIASIAAEKDIYVISDEIYEHLIYEGEHVSIASLGPGIKEKTIIINGAAKSYAMTGWRIGWAAGPEDIVKGMTKLQSQTTSNPTSNAQMAYLEALRGDQSSVHKMREAFRKRRDLIVGKLNEIDGISCPKPGGSFYVFPDVSGLSRDSMGFSDRLLENAKVAVVPGLAFGAEGHVRMSYACSEETINKGIERIRDFVRSA
jgi:aspartate aminotransferase